MINLKTMTMQLIDGEPDGIRICRVEGEPLVTVVVPRDKIGETKKLPKIPERGIYYLLDEDHGVISRVYAGQTTQGIRRLDDHKAKKEFWNKAVMFLTDSQNLAQDVLNGLEVKAIEFVRTHGSYEAVNSDTPAPYVDPYSESHIEKLHSSVLFRMAALGYDLDRTYEGPSIGDVFHTKKNGTRGVGRYNKETGKFTVLAGSQVALGQAVLKNTGITETRKQLFGDATDTVVLEEDLDFLSPSAAAVFVLGGSQNGWTEWIDDEGRTLDTVYRGGEG